MSIMDALGGLPGVGGNPSAGGPFAPGQGGGTPGMPDNPDAEQALQQAIDGLHTFLSVEEDDQDKATAAKCLASLQSIFGSHQKQSEAASGVTPAHKAMGRAYKRGGAQGAGYGG